MLLTNRLWTRHAVAITMKSSTTTQQAMIACNLGRPSHLEKAFGERVPSNALQENLTNLHGVAFSYSSITQITVITAAETSGHPSAVAVL